jgi:prolyl-tRNA synthetase
MKFTQLHTKTTKNVKDDGSTNARLLLQAGFVDQVMAGVYTFLPLGLRVITKIENIVRRNIDTIGAELLMPSVVPTDLWMRTGRLSTVDVLAQVSAANEHAKAKNDNVYIISPTHEEVVTPLAQRFVTSYKDLPCAYYQIQTKFRNEPRAKSGLLRCREFRMKDLYSFHANPDDLKKYYESTKDIYWQIYKELGIQNDTFIVQASGGDFSKDFSHEFQLRVSAGEDEIYRNTETGECFNSEVMSEKYDLQKFEKFNACEIGNIFILNTKFSDAFGLTYKDADGLNKSVYMGCYGIGISRIMGVMVEKYHDAKGIVWPESVAPYKFHIVGVDLHDTDIMQKSQNFYDLLASESSNDCIFDDRQDTRAGEKFADSDLIGCPVRVIISKKAGDRIEVKHRSSQESLMMSIDEFRHRYLEMSKSQ